MGKAIGSAWQGVDEIVSGWMLELGYLLWHEHAANPGGGPMVLPRGKASKKHRKPLSQLLLPDSRFGHILAIY